MDVKKLAALLFITHFLIACSDTNIRANQVTSSFQSAKCQGSAAIQNEFIVQWEDGRFTVEKGINPETFKENFVKPRAFEIRHVQINQEVYQLQDMTAQNVESLSTTDDWGVSRIEAEAVWSQGFRGQGVKVGIIDSQVDVEHYQLKPRIAINTNEIPDNGIDDDRNGIVDDYYGAKFISTSPDTKNANDHGTHVAGIVAADPTQGGISGVAPKAQLIPSAFLANSGGGTLGDAILAMQYAVSRGARILNASWGGSGCDESLFNAFSSFSQKGILMVVAAGNVSLDIDINPFYPAAFEFPGQVTVGASDDFDLMPTWSNNGFKRVHLTAPGDGILSTGIGNSHITMSGTSMAAPFVAGAAAVLWSAKPNATSVEIKQALLSGVDVAAGKQSRTLTRGRLNLRKALDELRRIVP